MSPPIATAVIPRWRAAARTVVILSEHSERRISLALVGARTPVFCVGIFRLGAHPSISKGARSIPILIRPTSCWGDYAAAARRAIASTSFPCVLRLSINSCASLACSSGRTAAMFSFSHPSRIPAITSFARRNSSSRVRMKFAKLPPEETPPAPSARSVKSAPPVRWLTRR